MSYLGREYVPPLPCFPNVLSQLSSESHEPRHHGRLQHLEMRCLDAELENCRWWLVDVAQDVPPVIPYRGKSRRRSILSPHLAGRLLGLSAFAHHRVLHYSQCRLENLHCPGWRQEALETCRMIMELQCCGGGKNLEGLYSSENGC
jgi:hypothetical protein